MVSHDAPAGEGLQVGTKLLWRAPGPEHVPKRISDRHRRMSDRMPDRMSEQISDKMPEQMTDRMPDKMSEHMPDRLLDKMQK